MSFLQQAFELVIKEAQVPERWFVCLVENAPYYGGPEEGGWYGSDMIVQAFKEYPSEVLAEEAAEQVRVMAEELTAQSKQEYGEHCVRQCDWLEARGLDADWLPEDDGPSEYRVIVTSKVPENRYGDRQYS